MFQEIGWIQFLTYLLVGLALYGIVVVYLYYRKDIDILTKNGVIGPTETDRRPATGSSIMGGVSSFDKKEAAMLSGTPCEACGHVPGSAIELTHVHEQNEQSSVVAKSYFSEVIDDEPAVRQTSVASTVASEAIDFNDSIDGAVDLEELMAAFSEASALLDDAPTGNGVPEQDAVISKERVLSILGNDNLLNSELASTMAVGLDRELPTESFSALEYLEVRKAA